MMSLPSTLGARRAGGRVTLEIAVQDVAGAVVARDGGADRVELCTALGVGGLTPSLGLVEAVAATGVETHVLVRPRAGGFVHTPQEVDVMVSDVAHVLRAGAAGVVIGALRADLTLDLDAMERLVAAAGGAVVTLHRCLDVLPEPARAITPLVELGVHRVLTSGGASAAREGTTAIGDLVATAAGRLEVMAGGGVRPGDIPELVRAGVDAVHLSARGRGAGAGPAGPGGGTGAAYDVTDPTLVSAAAAAVRGAGVR